MKAKPLPLNLSKKVSTESKVSAPSLRPKILSRESLNSSSEIQMLVRIEQLKEQAAVVEKDLQFKNAIKSKNQSKLEEQEAQIKALSALIESQNESLAEPETEHEIARVSESIEKEQAEIYDIQLQISRLDKKIVKVEKFAEQKANMLQKLLSEYLNLKADGVSNSRSDSESYHLTPSKSGGTRTFKKSQFSYMQFNQTPSGPSAPIRANLFSVKSTNQKCQEGVRREREHEPHRQPQKEPAPLRAHPRRQVRLLSLEQLPSLLGQFLQANCLLLKFQRRSQSLARHAQSQVAISTRTQSDRPDVTADR
jgi:hypothetical protein